MRAYARVVTDYATFAWLCYVYVALRLAASAYVGSSPTQPAKPCARHLKRVLLASDGVHDLYRRVGLPQLAELRRWREAVDREIAEVEAGNVSVLDPTSLRDRYQQFANMAPDLLSDFWELRRVPEAGCASTVRSRNVIGSTTLCKGYDQSSRVRALTRCP